MQTSGVRSRQYIYPLKIKTYTHHSKEFGSDSTQYHCAADDILACLDAVPVVEEVKSCDRLLTAEDKIKGIVFDGGDSLYHLLLYSGCKL